MKMKTMSSEKRLCSCCMEEHVVKKVCLKEHSSFKNTIVEYDAFYFYCDHAKEYFMDETMMQVNNLAIKNAYRISQGLLTSQEIIGIRDKYGISQADLCLLLGWGGKTITRYESHQVQDRAHDSILKKIDQDPEWFLELLSEEKDNISKTAYQKYYEKAISLFQKQRDLYLRKAIEAKYAVFFEQKHLQGNSELSLDRVVDVIRYFASSEQVTDLYATKLMKMLWYVDAFSFQQREKSITGLVYQAMPIGTVPIGYDFIFELKGIPCEMECVGEQVEYYFDLKDRDGCPSLDNDDINILKIVINRIGKLSDSEIYNYMRQEQAYNKTVEKGFVSFEHTLSLQF